MGRTKQFPCPSAVFLSVVPTKPCYTIVPVFVKGRYLLLAMSRLGMCVPVLLSGIFSSFGRAPQVPNDLEMNVSFEDCSRCSIASVRTPAIYQLSSQWLVAPSSKQAHRM